MATIKASPALQHMLGEVLADIPPPTGGTNYRLSLERNRLMQQKLSAKALDAAEAAWPGFSELMSELVKKEVEFMEKLYGQSGQRVA